MKKRLLSLFLTLILMVGYLPLAASATSRTADEAIAWAKSKVGQSIDYDGAYGAQCVDLILAYYNYLGVSTVSGNGKDYAWNALPSGWTRVEGGAPQKGDILVYSGTSDNGYYGHVAIYESDYVHYDQNVTGHYGVVRCTWHYNYNGNYWGYIRPNWSGSTPTPPAITLDAPWADEISETGAMLHSVIRNNRYPIPQVGCWVWKKSSGELLKTYRENIPSSIQTSNYINVWLQTGAEMGLSLEPGTEYDYQFFVELDGNTYQSDRKSFQTAGSAPKPVEKPADVKLSANMMQCSVGEKVTFQFSASNAVSYQLLQNGSVLLDNLTGTSTAVTMAQAGTYSFNARAVNSAGTSDSNTVAVTVTEKISSGKFVDVLPSQWFYEPVMWSTTKGLFSGVSADRFAPDNQMSRGMLATVLYRLKGSPTVSGDSGFWDVSASQYYAKPIKWAADNQIVSGMGGGSFAPDSSITREQLAVMLHNYERSFGSPSGQGDLSQFSDGGSVSPWAQSAVRWAVSEGILTGKGDGRLDPKGNATRAEVASMLYRFAN